MSLERQPPEDIGSEPLLSLLLLEDRGDLRGAARLWQTLAVRVEDGETRSMAAFRALEARRALGRPETQRQETPATCPARPA